MCRPWHRRDPSAPSPVRGDADHAGASQPGRGLRAGQGTLIPAISLATVYKNIHLFVARGLLSEVSLHHGSLRVELNGHPHHHMVCSRCKAIYDLDEAQLGDMPQPHRLPDGFIAERYSVDVLGLCSACQDAESSTLE